MNKLTLNKNFDPRTLAEDYIVVRRIYANFFASLTDEDWERPVKGTPKEWNLHETVGHLCALSGAGLASVECALRGEIYAFVGLENRYQFNDWNRRGIDEHLHLSRQDLCAEFLQILDQAIKILCSLRSGQEEITSAMPIYNRPVKIIEALSIIQLHAGLHHSAQVAEPALVPPLWKQLPPDVRHRIIGRVMRALSLLYRFDLGGELRTAFRFKMDGVGGGDWYVAVSPESAQGEEGVVDGPGLTLHLREPAIFCQMFTGRFNPILAILKGDLRLSGDVRLFPRFGYLFSVNARK